MTLGSEEQSPREQKDPQVVAAGWVRLGEGISRFGCPAHPGTAERDRARHNGAHGNSEHGNGAHGNETQGNQTGGKQGRCREGTPCGVAIGGQKRYRASDRRAAPATQTKDRNQSGLFMIGN